MIIGMCRGDGARPLEETLEGVRPQIVTISKDANSAVDTVSRQCGALRRYAELKINIQEKNKEVVQFHPKYISQALPFVIPRMVSGPDFFPDRPWRRTEPDAAKVRPAQFCAAFARRVEAPCRCDFTGLPVLPGSMNSLLFCLCPPPLGVYDEQQIEQDNSEVGEFHIS